MCADTKHDINNTKGRTWRGELTKVKVFQCASPTWEVTKFWFLFGSHKSWMHAIVSKDNHLKEQ